MAGQQDPASELSPADRLGQPPGLDRPFFARDALEVAPDLLGCVLELAAPAGPVAIRLTEVEAYRGADDPGSHAYRGRTARNAVMFGPAGHLYVYFTYGMHWCANLVCGPLGTASAVLLRAGEVIAGEQLARTRRPAARRDADLARGPARLASCLGLTGSDNGIDACAGGALRVYPRAAPAAADRSISGGRATALASPAQAGPVRIEWGPRVGLAGAAADFPWRCWLPGEPTVSIYRPAQPRRRSNKSTGRIAGARGMAGPGGPLG